MSTCSGVAPASSSKGRHLAPAALRVFKTANSADLMALQQQAACDTLEHSEKIWPCLHAGFGHLWRR